MMWLGFRTGAARPEVNARPYCDCWNDRTPIAWRNLDGCSCGEDNDLKEWLWELVDTNSSSSVVVSHDQKLVTFHPLYSSGTAVVRGNTPLMRNQHYYWEVKMLTNTYGTDIMIGIGTDKVNIGDSQFKFISLLGEDAESYGLSYRGVVSHDAQKGQECPGFCRGTIVGVRVDMWKGTLEFYINRKPQGIAFYNLRRHDVLYPMLCSTAAQSSLRLIYAASWQASLLVDAAKILAASVKTARLPPGLWHKMKTQFWLTLPDAGYIDEEAPSTLTSSSSSMEADSVNNVVARSILGEILPSPYMNGFYVDNVERDSRLVVADRYE